MANECYLNVVFKGEPEVLATIQKELTQEDRFKRKTLSYSLIKDLVPGIEDKYLYGLFGWDEMDSFNKLYTPEQEATFENKVQTLLKANNWIGKRDDYINDSVRLMKSSIDNDILKVDVSLAWYAPVDFFKFVADKYNVSMSAINKIQGNLTSLIVKHDGKYIEIDPSKGEDILKDNSLINLSISNGLLKAEDLLLTSIYYHEDKAKEFILENYIIDSKELENSKKRLIDFYKDIDIYVESPLHKESKNRDSKEFKAILNTSYDIANSLTANRSTAKKTI